MASFSEHDKIAEIAGIPQHISNEINRFIDDIDPPKEFEEHNTERKIFVCGHLSVSIRTLIGSEKLHERGKKESVQQEDLKWLLATRKEYIFCYYLHLAIDNIYEKNIGKKCRGKTISYCLNSWRDKHAVTIPGTEVYLDNVLDFLKNNREEISRIIHPLQE